MESVVNRGWLHEPYRLFHSRDHRDLDFTSHYHDFHKVVFCLAGSVTYTIEGNEYRLGPGSLLVIPQGKIHRSRIHGEETYERYILWVQASFLAGWGEAALDRVFSGCREEGALLRPARGDRDALAGRLAAAEAAAARGGEGSGLYADTCVVQFLLTLSPLIRRGARDRAARPVRDRRMAEVMAYIQEHLSEELSVQGLADRFFFSPSWLMHRFARCAGCTLYRYILQKRLLRAAEAIAGGTPVLAAAAQAGFGDYTSFLRAFRKQYGCVPTELRKNGTIQG